MEKTKVVRTRFSKLSISKHIELEDGNKDSATLTWSTRMAILELQFILVIRKHLVRMEK